MQHLLLKKLLLHGKKKSEGCLLYLDLNIDIFLYSRPLDTSDCPICFEEFEEQVIDQIDFCKTCGNNVHKVTKDKYIIQRCIYS